MSYDVFICAASEDYQYAEQVFSFLKGKWYAIFFSEETIPDLGVDDFRRNIMQAIDDSYNMVVVTSSEKYVNKTWVMEEWGTFLNEKLAGNKTGDLMLVLVGSVQHKLLPIDLRYKQAFTFKSLDKLITSLGPLQFGFQTEIRYVREWVGEIEKVHKVDASECRVFGSQRAFYACLGNYVLSVKARNELETALLLHKEEERICRESGNKRSLQISLGNQALIYRKLKNFDQALNLHKEEEKICEIINNKYGLQSFIGGQVNIF